MEDIKNSWICKQFIAHRGLHDNVSPENSLSAYQKAIDEGFAIEIDVRPLACGTIVSFHDGFLDRLTKDMGDIEQRTYEEVKDLTLLDSQEKIPTLKEVLSLIDGKVPLLVEIKNEGKVGFEKDVYELLKSYKGEYAVQSFNPYSLKWFKDNAPEVARGQLAGFFKKDKLNFIKKFALKRMLLNKKVSEPHFVSYEVGSLPNKWVDKAKKQGKVVLAWVVRNKEEQQRIKGYADNIIFEDFIPEVK